MLQLEMVCHLTMENIDMSISKFYKEAIAWAKGGGARAAGIATYATDPLTGGISGLTGPQGVLPLGEPPKRSLLLWGDSNMGNVNTNAQPSAIAYDNTTGVITLTLASHGHYTDMDCHIGFAGYPSWNTYGLRVTVVDSNKVSLQLAAGLGTPPLASTCRFYIDTQYHEQSPFTWLKGARPKLVNMGVNGETVAQIVDRVDKVLASYSQLVWFRAGTNNVTTDTAGAVADLVRIEAALLKVKGYKKIIVSTIPPAQSTAVNARYALTLNAGIVDIATRLGLFLIDEYAIGVDPASATGASKTGYQQDAIHFSSIYSRYVAAQLQLILDSVYGTVFSPCPKSAMDGYSAGNNPNSANAFDNPMLQTASGGTNGNPTQVSGTVAGSLAVYTAGGWGAGSVTASVVAATDGFGNAQRLVGSPTAAADSLRITTNATGVASAVAGRLVAGEKRKCVAKIRTSGVTGQAVVKSLMMRVTLVTGEGTFSSRVVDHNYGNTAAEYLQTDVDQVFETPEFTVPVGLTSIYIDVMLTFVAAGTAVTLDVSALGILKV